MVLFKNYRFIFCFIFLIILSSFIYAADYNVGIYPDNSEIRSFININFLQKHYTDSTAEVINNRLNKENKITLGRNLAKTYESEKASDISSAESVYNNSNIEPILPVDLTVKIIDINENFSIDSTSLNNKTAEYLTNKYNLDLIIFPIKEELSDLNYLTLYTYDTETREINLIYGEIKQTSDVYGPSVLKSMAYLFMNDTDADQFIYNLENGVEDVKSEFEFNLTSNVNASVYLDGILSGITPFVFKDSLPISISLRSDGYIEQTINITSPQENIYVELKPQWMSDFNFYNKARNNFYWAFTRVLSSFALSIVSNSINLEDLRLRNAIKSFAIGTSVLNLVDLFSNLSDYYRFADYVSP